MFHITLQSLYKFLWKLKYRINRLLLIPYTICLFDLKIHVVQEVTKDIWKIEDVPLILRISVSWSFGPFFLFGFFADVQFGECSPRA